MDTYDRAEIVEDHSSKKLRVYLFSGDKRVNGPVYDLRSDYVDVDIDEIRAEITSKHGIPSAQITKRREGRVADLVAHARQEEKAAQGVSLLFERLSVWVHCPHSPRLGTRSGLEPSGPESHQVGLVENRHWGISMSKRKGGYARVRSIGPALHEIYPRGVLARRANTTVLWRMGVTKRASY